MKMLLYSLGIILFVSCNWRTYKPAIDNRDYSKKVLGWKAKYAADTAVKKIKFYNTARPMIAAGKIYVFGNTIFQNDIGKGIHLIDNSSPSNAQRVAFIELGGNTDISIKGNYLYANNYNDMVVIDITNITAPVEIKRFKGVFNTMDSQRPYTWQAPPDTGFYECPRYFNDSMIVSWVKDSVQQFCQRRF